MHKSAVDPESLSEDTFIQMSKVLVIGSSGYIGSKLTHFLETNGLDVCGIDKKKSFQSKIPTNLMDYGDLLKSDIKDFKHIVLLAAHSSVFESTQDPIGTLINNVVNLQNLLSIMSEDQILYFASSASVYDGIKGVQAEEIETLKTPRNIYDLSKRTGEELIAINSIKSLIFRFGTVNGSSPNMRFDLVINAMVLSAMKNKKVYLSNPHVHRAILSIDDLCSAVTHSIQMNIAESKSEIINLLSFNTTIGEIATQISEYFEVPIIEKETGPTYDFSMSAMKADSILGFKPKHSIMDIVKGIEHNIQKIQND